MTDTGHRIVARPLLAWYRRRARDLPWRRTGDPYAIWVSEVMLQQTRVETVRGYYDRFLARFPSLATLARAREQSVLKAWEGLGYYARARHLHAAAREAAARYGGVPGTHDALRALPGVGRYTAAAVAAIAFGERRLPLDGNIRRVLARLFDLARAGEADYLCRGEPLLDGLTRARVGSMVQALMELGACVCLPRNPRCDACPVRRACRALAAGTIEQRPARRARAATPHYEVVVATLRDARGRVLLVQRPRAGLLGGLWELPGGKVHAGEPRARAIRRELREETGITRLRGLRYLGCVDHAYTHFSVTLHLFTAATAQEIAGLHGPAAARWVVPGRVSREPLPRGTQKLLALHAEALGRPQIAD
jgi:A/G-specific adenine glycosylase